MYNKRLTRFLKPIFISILWSNHKRYLKIDPVPTIALFVPYNFLIVHLLDLETPSTPKLEFLGLRLMKTRFFGDAKYGRTIVAKIFGISKNVNKLSNVHILRQFI